MKKQTILLIVIFLSTSFSSFSQNITVRSLNASPFKWPGNIQFDNNVGIKTTIQNSSVESPGRIEFLDQQVELTDVTINCETLYFSNVVTDLYIQGKVTINCRNIVFQAAAGGSAAILLDNPRGKQGSITVNYTNDFTQNNRNIEVVNTTNLKLSFSKQSNQ